jgi:hypothetical protein
MSARHNRQVIYFWGQPIDRNINFTYTLPSKGGVISRTASPARDSSRRITRGIQEILDGSKQAIYVYLDNEHKICNERFATLIGYKSLRDYETVEDPLADVDESSVENLVGAYQNAMQKQIGSQIPVTWKKRAGGSVKSDVILVPIAFKGEMLALHYITAK